MARKTALLPSFGIMSSSENQLLASIILLVLGFPFFDSMKHGREIQGGLFSLVYVMGLLAVGGRRKTLLWGTLLLVPALVVRWCNEFDPNLAPASLVLVFALLLLGFVIANLFGFIVRAPRVSSEVLSAAISTYLLLAVFWAFFYMLLWQITPNSFSMPAALDSAPPEFDFHSALYFSFITLATVGYGDIVPRLPLARTLAFTEAVVGTFYMAILIARLVTQYSSEKSLVSSDKG